MKKINVALLAMLLSSIVIFAFVLPKESKTNKATTVNKVTDPTKRTCYFFKVLNNVLKDHCAELILEFPTADPSTDPLTFGCDAPPQTYFCIVGFPSFIIKADGKRYPADANGVEITNYCNFICVAYRKTPR